jgi:hypothetical protein
VSPHTLRLMHAWLTLLWLLLALPGILLWRESVPFLVGVSIYANFVGHLSSWQAARAEEASS